jgi:hypothetical protein
MKQNIWLARFGIAAWPSFIGAGLLTTIIFFNIDAHDLILISGSRLDDHGIYSVTFIILWLFGSICGGASAWLTSTSRAPSTHADRRHPPGTPKI